VEPNEKNFRLLLANIEMLKDVIKEKGLYVHALRKALWIKRGVCLRFRTFPTILQLCCKEHRAERVAKKGKIIPIGFS
jgi:hypothetical protein